MTSAWEAAVTTARRASGMRGSRRPQVAWSMDSDPKRRSTCLGYWERLKGQNRVPEPPARMTPTHNSCTPELIISHQFPVNGFIGGRPGNMREAGYIIHFNLGPKPEVKPRSISILFNKYNI